MSGSPLSVVNLIRIQDCFINDASKKALLSAGATRYYALVTLEPPHVEENLNLPMNRWDAAAADYNPTFSSVLGRYFVVITSGEDEIRIYKNGVLIQTISMLPSYAPNGGAFISPSGKYLLWMDGTRSELHIYKGA